MLRRELLDHYYSNSHPINDRTRSGHHHAAHPEGRGRGLLKLKRAGMTLRDVQVLTIL